jgi:hypothetical protein
MEECDDQIDENSLENNFKSDEQTEIVALNI